MALGTTDFLDQATQILKESRAEFAIVMLDKNSKGVGIFRYRLGLRKKSRDQAYSGLCTAFEQILDVVADDSD